MVVKQDVSTSVGPILVCVIVATRETMELVKVLESTMVAVYYNYVDIDECSDPMVCGPVAQCVNQVGTYRCECNSGYEKIRNGNCEGVYNLLVKSYNTKNGVCLGSYLVCCCCGFLQILMSALPTSLCVLILVRNVSIFQEHLAVSVRMATSCCRMETV